MKDAIASIILVLAFMGIEIGSTFLAERIHPDDTELPAYKQRIRLGRGYRGSSWGERWKIWLTWAFLPFVGLAIILFNP